MKTTIIRIYENPCFVSDEAFDEIMRRVKPIQLTEADLETAVISGFDGFEKKDEP